MSYSMNFVVEMSGQALFESLSPTYNLAPMFERALGFPIGDLEGKTPAECLPHLQRAYIFLITNEEECRSLEPANKWGTYGGAVEAMRTLLRWAETLTRRIVLRL